MEVITEKVKEIASKPSYSSVAGKKSKVRDEQKTTLPRKLVQSLDNMTKVSRESQTADKLICT